MAQTPKTPAQIAALDTKMAAEAAYRAAVKDRTVSNAEVAAVKATAAAAAAAYIAAMPAPRGSFWSRGDTAGKRQHKAQQARTAEAIRRKELQKQFR